MHCAARGEGKGYPRIRVAGATVDETRTRECGRDHAHHVAADDARIRVDRDHARKVVEGTVRRVVFRTRRDRVGNSPPGAIVCHGSAARTTRSRMRSTASFSSPDVPVEATS